MSILAVALLSLAFFVAPAKTSPSVLNRDLVGPSLKELLG